MPLVNYIVEINLPDVSPEVILNLASDIEDAIAPVADVTSVKPWARPATGLTSDFIQQAQPASQPFTPPA